MNTDEDEDEDEDRNERIVRYTLREGNGDTDTDGEDREGDSEEYLCVHTICCGNVPRETHGHMHAWIYGQISSRKQMKEEEAQAQAHGCMETWAHKKKCMLYESMCLCPLSHNCTEIRQRRKWNIR